MAQKRLQKTTNSQTKKQRKNPKEDRFKKIYKALQLEAKSYRLLHLRQLFSKDQKRAEKFQLSLPHLHLDYAKSLLQNKTLQKLLMLAKASQLPEKIAAMFEGQRINLTEDRPVLHTALRSFADQTILVNNENVVPKIHDVLKRMAALSEGIRQGKIKGYTGKVFRAVVNIGIGGSDLGPQMVCEALKAFSNEHIQMHFVSNVDGSHLYETLKQLKADETLFIIASKTFTTQETLLNAHTAKAWFFEQGSPPSAIAQHFVALSTAKKEVEAFGILEDRMFEFWDFVGGRYSLWSAIGLSIMIAIGSEHFQQFLAGARDMDAHFLQAPLAENMPVLMALIGFWYRNFLHTTSYAILPYNQYLRRFPAYLQQVDMESNGKRVNRQGKTLTYPTAPVLWGEPGTNGQHAFFQLLHQGSDSIPADFIVAATSPHTPLQAQHYLLANCLAQSEALAFGQTQEEAYAKLQQEDLAKNKTSQEDKKRALFLSHHKTFPGNKPSLTIVLSALTPYTLGQLIALYEHKIFCQGVLWHINSFDQFGVELGKEIALHIVPSLLQNSEKTAQKTQFPALHPATQSLLNRIQSICPKLSSSN